MAAHGPLTPARIVFDADGRLQAPDFGDAYHARIGATAQAQAVFLAGNGLPRRWRGRADFTIAENGFGVGQNFLATWAAWRDDPTFTDRERAALDLAETMTRIADGGRVSDDVWDAAAAAFDEAELASLVQVVAIINAFNRINVATERGSNHYLEYASHR